MMLRPVLLTTTKRPPGSDIDRPARFAGAAGLH
jgi:hypothetical protein